MRARLFSCRWMRWRVLPAIVYQQHVHLQLNATYSIWLYALIYQYNTHIQIVMPLISRCRAQNRLLFGCCCCCGSWFGRRFGLNHDQKSRFWHSYFELYAKSTVERSIIQASLCHTPLWVAPTHMLSLNNCFYWITKVNGSLWSPMRFVLIRSPGGNTK